VIRQGPPRKLVVFLLGALALGLGTVACNQLSGQWSNSLDPYAPLTVQEASAKLNYAYIKNNILDRYCTSCHGTDGGVNLESPNSVRSYATKIMAVMADRSMPKDDTLGTMTVTDRAVLYNWAKAGAPTGTGAVQPLYPPLSADDAALKLNYAYMQANILVPYCLACHGTAGKVNVESLDAIRANSKKIISTIAGSKSMPKGNRALKINEVDRAALYNWLVAGAPEGYAPVPSPFITLPALTDQEAAEKMNYNYVRDNIITPKCISCHGSSGHVDMQSYDSVVKNSKKIFFALFSTSPSMPPFGPLKPNWNSHTQPIPDPIPANRVLSSAC